MKEDLDCVHKELIDLVRSGMLVLVEGKRDQESLKSLGFSNIMIIDTHMDEIASRIASQTKTCAILTDLDPAGRCVYSKIKRYIEARGVKVNDGLRRTLLVSSRLRNIEGLHRYLVSHGF